MTEMVTLPKDYLQIYQDAAREVLGMCLENPHLARDLAVELFIATPDKILLSAIQSVPGKGDTEHHIKIAERIIEDGHEGVFGGSVRIYDYLSDAARVPLPVSEFERQVGILEACHIRRKREKIAHIASSDTDDEKAFEEIQALLTRPTCRQRAWSAAAEDIRTVLENIEQRFRAGGMSGLSTGFMDFDKMTSGFHPSDFIILAARPSMGKSMLAVNIAWHVAQAAPVLVISLEMSRSQIQQRILADIANVPLWRIRDGRILKELQWESITQAASLIYKSHLIIDDTPGVDIKELLHVCGAVQAAYPDLALIVIDYIQLLRDESAHSLYERVTNASQAIKEVARKLSVPVLALSQLSREIGKRPDRRPQLPDLRESGALEQDADTIAFIHREDYFDDSLPKQDYAEVIIRKQRNGPVGTIRLRYDPEYMRFTDFT